MQFVPLFLATLFGLGVLTASKTFAFNYLNLDLIWLQVVFGLWLAAVTTAAVRRIGVITYFECFLLMFIWLMFGFLIDVVVTANLVTDSIYTNINWYGSHVVILLSIFLFHKKLHIETRKTMKAK
jgi:hypothetical protein